MCRIRIIEWTSIKYYKNLYRMSSSAQNDLIKGCFSDRFFGQRPIEINGVGIAHKELSCLPPQICFNKSFFQHVSPSHLQADSPLHSSIPPPSIVWSWSANVNLEDIMSFFQFKNVSTNFTQLCPTDFRITPSKSPR